MTIPVLVDMTALQATLDRIDARAKTLKDLAFVTVMMWIRKPRWRAVAHYLAMEAEADEPDEALAALARLIERRIASDAAVARTLGIEEAA